MCEAVRQIVRIFILSCPIFIAAVDITLRLWKIKSSFSDLHTLPIHYNSLLRFTIATSLFCCLLSAFAFPSLLTCEFSDVTGTNIASHLRVQFQFTSMHK
jgi:hypothetical protein